MIFIHGCVNLSLVLQKLQIIFEISIEIQRISNVVNMYAYEFG